jgi:flagellar biosynthesis protein FlhF
MRMVKEELGADAVIMSNRAVDGGIEIVAARDFDEQSIRSKLQEQANEHQQPAANKTKTVEWPNFQAEKNRLELSAGGEKKDVDGFVSERPAHGTIDQYVGYAEKMQLRGKEDIVSTIVSTKAARPTAPVLAVAKEKPVEKAKATESKQYSLSDKLLMEMCKELKSLRSSFDGKLTEAALPHGLQANPLRTNLLHRLGGMSISKKTSVKIANLLNSYANIELAFAKTQEILADMLPMAEDELLDVGGIAALVGPTGVGKTTTIAKLAAQFILKHGPKQVAMITTDNYRIGAHEQLNTYGRILDVPVRVASSRDELSHLINGFADKRLILIDTAGMSQRDMKLVEQIKTLQQSHFPIKSYLVMSAATEYKAMNEIINAFRIFEPQAGILTKLDEAVKIGSALSSLIEQNLPLSFIATGQRVPEDLFSPSARSLVDHCVIESKSETSYTDFEHYETSMAQGYA